MIALEYLHCQGKLLLGLYTCIWHHDNIVVAFSFNSWNFLQLGRCLLTNISKSLGWTYHAAIFFFSFKSSSFICWCASSLHHKISVLARNLASKKVLMYTKTLALEPSLIWHCLVRVYRDNISRFEARKCVTPEQWACVPNRFWFVMFNI